MALVAFAAVYVVQAYLVASGPSTAGFGYVVSKTTDVSILQTTIGLYYDTNTAKTVTIQNGHICDFDTDSTETNQMGDHARSPKGHIFNTFKLYKTTASEAFNGEIDTADAMVKRAKTDTTGCTTAGTDDITMTIPSSAMVRSSLTGKYVAILRANVIGDWDNQNAFRVSAPGGLVGVIGANSSDPALARGAQAGYNYNPAGTIPRKWGNEDIFFGTPCNITSNTTAYIHFFDIDSNVDAIQRSDFDIRVGVWDLTAGSYAPSSNVSGFTSVGTNQWMPNTGTQSYATLRFTAQPNHKYRLDLNNHDSNNTIQMTLPYNSIYADINCNSIAPELDPGVSLDPNTIVQVGDTVTGTFTVRELNGFTGGVADFARRMWIENGANTTFDAGDQSLYFFGAPDGYFAPGSTTTHTFTSGAITGGNRVCASYGLTAKMTAGGMTQIAGANPEVVCVPIGKYPKLQVQNGDVWVGGGLSGAACATGSGQDYIYGAPNNGSVNSSFANYGVAAAGDITQFGSAGLGLGGLHSPSAAPETLTFSSGGAFNGSFWGNQSSSPINCLTDPSSEYNTLPIAGSVTMPGGAALTLGSGGVYERHYTGTVTINQNMTYQNTPYAYGQFPRIVVVADGDIIINPNVTQLDGIYIAKGKVYTCGSTNAATNVRRGAACDNNLTVNGALFAGGRLIPWRAGGAIAPNLADKAELINVRPDIYYSECQRVCSNGMRTITQQEMPVRF